MTVDRRYSAYMPDSVPAVTGQQDCGASRYARCPALDVKQKEVSLDARHVTMDSTAKEDPLKAGTSLLLGLVRVEGQFLLTVPFTVVSGGPKTPREQTAARLAIAKAIQLWISIHPSNKKIESSD